MAPAAEISERVGVLESQQGSTLLAIAALAERTEKLDAKIELKFDKLANRLPVWATLLISSLTLAVGVFANAALK